MASERIRLTISVSPEAHQVFSRMAEASGLSLGRCMGDWLTDTIEGAEFVAAKMEEARKAPRVVMREMQALAKGLTVEVDSVMESLRGSKRGPLASPPSSNTGGKVPRKNPNPRAPRP